MGKRSRAKQLKTANTLAQSWAEVQQRHKNWPKFSGKYGQPQKPKLFSNQLRGTTTGRMTSDRPNIQDPKWEFLLVDHVPGQETLVQKLDFTELERRVAGVAFDYCKDGEAKAAFIERFGQEEWDRREQAAREVKHTVLPMHKSNYVLVTDPEMIPLMVSKPGSKT